MLCPLAVICYIVLSFDFQGLQCLILMQCFIFHFLVAQEKLRGSLRAYTQAAPWTPLALEKFSNTGIVVGPKTPLTPDALQHLTLRMMIDYATIYGHSIQNVYGYYQLSFVVSFETAVTAIYFYGPYFPKCKAFSCSAFTKLQHHLLFVALCVNRIQMLCFICKNMERKTQVFDLSTNICSKYASSTLIF